MSNDEGSDNALNPNMRYRAYKPLLHMTNIDQSSEGGFEISHLPHKTLGHASTSRDVQVLDFVWLHSIVLQSMGWKKESYRQVALWLGQFIQLPLPMLLGVGSVCSRLYNRSENAPSMLRRSVSPWEKSIPLVLLDI
ncbi:hypothetical protein PVK06_005187 [Gossypium arboreum]|uniref:Uncharacterized protein n=1 Tax=Gossypium arboreum TaxID=29729 RepID=A0ABR0QV05_GOSAR|nr:hypothetical protein PVK06_005187 [Gossypium arboreum]